eukprot:TRINITY_DN27641_c0_g1_i1.p1 TRINITY_DN27641_c0_g1~~TRINITY_DN27641_c0_g1_i1.p1  ORF type:complete len:468 (-),score=75.51 TRINITY_DN27641_c0_g1_i1:468-1871(-)
MALVGASLIRAQDVLLFRDVTPSGSNRLDTSHACSSTPRQRIRLTLPIGSARRQGRKQNGRGHPLLGEAKSANTRGESSSPTVDTPPVPSSSPEDPHPSSSNGASIERDATSTERDDHASETGPKSSGEEIENASESEETGEASKPFFSRVQDMVAEDAAIVAEVVELGVEVAAKVGELPASVAEQPSDKQKAALTVGFWVASAVLFGIGVGVTEGPGKASEFFAGYLLEQSLSVDNLLVFVLIFSYFKVPASYQPRVLTYGLAGAVTFRAIMIGLGVATLRAFSGVNLIFAIILLFSSYKLLADSADEEDDDLSNNSIVLFCRRFIKVSPNYDGSNFFTMVNGVSQATPLLLTLAVVEVSDVVFAVDSIPAVFGVTRDPFIVFSSNMFAILGLRSLYIVVSSSMADLKYLQPAVAIVLGFIGLKMAADFFGFEVPTESSLVVVASVLGAGIALSLRERTGEDEDNK